jgi:hypothetical protein
VAEASDRELRRENSPPVFPRVRLLSAGADIRLDDGQRGPSRACFRRLKGLHGEVSALREVCDAQPLSFAKGTHIAQKGFQASRLLHVWSILS